MRRAGLLLLSAGFAFGCSDARQQDDAESAQPGQQVAAPERLDGAGDLVELSCAEGPAASFRFLGPETIEIRVDAERYVLSQQRSASGARYQGDGIELWNKGRESMLRIGEASYRCTTAGAHP